MEIESGKATAECSQSPTALHVLAAYSSWNREPRVICGRSAMLVLLVVVVEMRFEASSLTFHGKGLGLWVADHFSTVATTVTDSSAHEAKEAARFIQGCVSMSTVVWRLSSMVHTCVAFLGGQNLGLTRISRVRLRAQPWNVICNR